MEHRLNMRHPIRMEAWIEFPGRKVLPVHTQDMSIRGTYVETHSPIPPYAIVRLRFRDAENGISVEIPAVITRRNASGIGLMFGNLSRSMRRRMQALLHRGNNLLDTRTAVI